MDAAAAEFPFVESLPKRERKSVVKLWQQYENLQSEHGQLLPPHLAAAMLNVSRARVSQMCEAKILDRVYFDGHAMVTAASVKARAAAERAVGRPPKVSLREVLSAGLASLKS